MSDGIVVWVQERRSGDPLIKQEPQISLLHPSTEIGDIAFDLLAINEALLSQLKAGKLEPDVVQQIGGALAAALQHHPKIASELELILEKGGGPIHLRLDAPAADALPWEALHLKDTGFLAFNQKWPIARVKKMRREVNTKTLFVPPLKIFAVMAATGENVPADDEWQALYDAVKDSMLNVRLRVLVCDDALKAAIEALPEASPNGWIECDFVTDGLGLFQQIATFEPHILHFFCHGVAGSPAFLQAGNKIDFKRKQPGSVTIQADQLRQRADTQENVWLVTLDCCETAAQTADGGARARSFASALVLEGFPAVVGMREPVEQQVAATFCGLFYRQFLGDLRVGLRDARKNGKPYQFHWASCLFAARQEICQAANPQKPISEIAPAMKDWTIPVLYTRTENFSLNVGADGQGVAPIERPLPTAPPPAPAQPPAGAASMQVLIGELQELTLRRAQIAGMSTLPEAVREPILAKIDARILELQKELSA